MDNWILNKTIIITGATSGIGKALTKQLIFEYGCSVIGVGLSRAHANELNKELGDKADKLTISLMDVSSLEAWSKFAKNLEKKGIYPNVLINCAGVFPGFNKFDKMDVNIFENTMKTNFFGAVYGCNTMMPILRKNSECGIINISSSVALAGIAGVSAYSASKCALSGFTTSLTLEYMDEMYIACVYPGFTDTNLFTRNSEFVKSENMQKMCSSTDDIASEIIANVIKKKTRIVVGKDAKKMEKVARWLPVKGVNIMRDKMKESMDPNFELVFEYAQEYRKKEEEKALIEAEKEREAQRVAEERERARIQEENERIAKAEVEEKKRAEVQAQKDAEKAKKEAERNERLRRLQELQVKNAEDKAKAQEEAKQREIAKKESRVRANIDRKDREEESGRLEGARKNQFDYINANFSKYNYSAIEKAEKEQAEREEEERRIAEAEREKREREEKKQKALMQKEAEKAKKEREREKAKIAREKEIAREQKEKERLAKEQEKQALLAEKEKLAKEKEALKEALAKNKAECKNNENEKDETKKKVNYSESDILKIRKSAKKENKVADDKKEVEELAVKDSKAVVDKKLVVKQDTNLPQESANKKKRTKNAGIDEYIECVFITPDSKVGAKKAKKDAQTEEIVEPVKKSAKTTKKANVLDAKIEDELVSKNSEKFNTIESDETKNADVKQEKKVTKPAKKKAVAKVAETKEIADKEDNKIEPKSVVEKEQQINEVPVKTAKKRTAKVAKDETKNNKNSAKKSDSAVAPKEKKAQKKVKAVENTEIEYPVSDNANDEDDLAKISSKFDAKLNLSLLKTGSLFADADEAKRSIAKAEKRKMIASEANENDKENVKENKNARISNLLNLTQKLK